MSSITDADMGSPFADSSAKKLRQIIMRMTLFQTTAVDGNIMFANPVAPQAMTIRDVYMQFGKQAAANETFSISLESSIDGGANWVARMAAPIVYGLTGGANVVFTPGAQKSFFAAITDPVVLAGTIFRLVIDYTAGGGPTPMLNNACVIELS